MLKKKLMDTLRKNKKKVAVISLSTVIVAGGAIVGGIVFNEYSEDGKAQTKAEQPVEEEHVDPMTGATPLASTSPVE